MNTSNICSKCDLRGGKGALDDLAVLLERNWTNGPPENITKAIEEGPA